MSYSLSWRTGGSEEHQVIFNHTPQDSAESGQKVQINGRLYSLSGSVKDTSLVLDSLRQRSFSSIEEFQNTLEQLTTFSNYSFHEVFSDSGSIVVKKTNDICINTLNAITGAPIQDSETSKAQSIHISAISTSGEIVEGDKGAVLDVYLQSLTENTSFRGSVVVVKGGETILSKGYGNATITEKNSANTVFHIGSVTKNFTAAAVMKLVERGIIDLNGTINQYLPDRYRSDQWKDVTVKQLMAHTSGISNYTDAPDYFINCKNLTKEMILENAVKEPLKTAPGSTLSYSNTGYLLLGSIIEEQSGVSYGEFMKRELFFPAGMTKTGVHDISFENNHHHMMAMGFCPDPSGENLIEDVTENLSQTCGADGAIFSSLQDLVKWNHIMDAGGGILAEESLRLMKTPVKEGYGLGFGIDQKFGTSQFSHDGLVPGFRSSFVKYPDKDLFIAVLCNNGKFPTRLVADYIAEISLDLIDEAVTITPHDFRGDSRLGIFKSINGNVQIELIEKEGRLFMKGIDKPGTASECYLLSNHRILHPDGIKFEFYNNLVTAYSDHEITNDNPDGKVDELVRVSLV